MGIIQRPITKKLSGDLHPDNNVNDKSILFVNELTREEEDMDKINKYIKTEHKGDFEVMPQCNCGSLSGPMLIVGNKVCLVCNSPATLRSEKPLKPIVYVRRPKGVAPLLLPYVWYMIMNLTKVGKFNTLLYMTNSSYTFKPVGGRKTLQHNEFLEELNKIGFERDYNYFVNNLGRILTGLVNMKYLVRNANAKSMIEHYDSHGHDFFVDNLYVLNKSLVVIDKNATGCYMDSRLKSTHNAIRSVIGIDISGLTPHQKGNKMSKFIDEISTFYAKYINERFNRKSGLWKKHVFNMKGVHISRAVIVSQAGVHDQERLGVPWTIGVALLEQFIVAKLLHRGFCMNEAKRIHHKYIHIYNEYIHDIIKEVIANTKHGKFFIMAQRFPTLTQASMMRLYFDDVDISPEDHAFRLSIIGVRGSNADFDGDNIHVLLLPDTISEESWEPFDYHYHIFNPMAYREMSGTLSLTAQTVMNYEGWIEGCAINENTDKVKEQNMWALFE